MSGYIPEEKLSKKKKKELAKEKRGSWGGLSPVTRKPQPLKAYQRSQAKQWKKFIEE